MEGEELRAGKERVKIHLIDPLNAIGMVRKKGMTIDTHQSVMDGLMARLSYMDEDFLCALAEVVEAHAGGPDKDYWPALTLITGWARALQDPPPSESRLVRSFLQSAPGQRATDGGYIVELRQFLKRNGRPPGDYDMKQILDNASRNSSERTRIEKSLQGDRVSDQDRQWLEGWRSAYDTCMTIIDGKHKGAAA